jgi:hypothetical protein
VTIRAGLTVIHSYRQCMYIVFIVQCKKNSKTSAKIRRTSVISIIFKGVFLSCSCYTVISFYCLLYMCMNQVPGDFYIYTRWLKHKFISKPLLYRRCHYCRITTIIGCLLIRITCLSCVDCYINELALYKSSSSCSSDRKQTSSSKNDLFLPRYGWKH